jgi:UDP-3-O-[3-hydroxymyristoyl] glucosamine N-acyltransferase
MSNSITLQQLTELVGGKLCDGNADSLITGLNSIRDARSGEVTFLGNVRYLPALKTTRATVALVPDDLPAQEAQPGTRAHSRQQPHARLLQRHSHCLAA